MSRHANQAGGAPTSSREGIQGAGATYRASVQKQSRTQSSTKAGGSNKRQSDPSVDGAKRTTKTTVVNGVAGTNANIGGIGDGHYVKA